MPIIIVATKIAAITLAMVLFVFGLFMLIIFLTSLLKLTLPRKDIINYVKNFCNLFHYYDIHCLVCL